MHMITSNPGSRSTSLATTHNVTVVYVLSLIIGLLMAISSVAGIMYQTSLYPTEELRSWLVNNDLFNLVVGLPFLLISMWLARRGKLIGLLCWPGALYYVLYVYVAYVIGAPFGALFLPHLLLATLSAYTLIGLMASIDGEVVRQKLVGTVPARTTGGILLALALLIHLREVGLIVSALIDQTPVAPSELAQWIDDFAVGCPALLGLGIALWLRRALGYVGGAGLLLAYGILSLSLVPIMVSGSPVDVAGIVIVAVMAGLCFVPFAFFVRGSIRT
jgi:hypothetical protein